MNKASLSIFVSLPILLGACASLPDGPSVMVLPGSGMTFEQFQIDDANCQAFALNQVGGTTPSQASINSAAASAAVGTALGAGLGAAAGGGSGAAIGAGAGLAAGTIAGSSGASRSWYSTQQRYDIGYIQCMYAKGHRVPVNGQFSPQAVAPVVTPGTPAPAATHIPPPPAGSPPPPPPLKP